MSRSPRSVPVPLVLDFVATALVAAIALRLASRGVHLQWDLKVYLAAARAAVAGLDPYSLADLAQVSPRPITLPFVYPPVALVPFIALGALAGAAAPAVWMFGKLGLLAAGVIAVRRRFAPALPWSAVAALALFASNAAALWDLRAGNVGTIEAALVVTAIQWFTRGWSVAFAVTIVAAACFKLTPAVFLLLLLVPTAAAPPRPRLFGAACAAMLTLVALPYAFPPANAWPAFWSSIPAELPVGDANPSLAAFFDVCLRAGWPDASSRAPCVFALWVGMSAGIVGASVPWLIRAWRKRDAATWAMGMIALGLLVAPRSMAYGWVIAAAPLAWLVARVSRGRSIAMAGLVVLLCAQGIAQELHHPFTGTLAAPLPSVALLALWVVEIVQERSGATGGLQSARPIDPESEIEAARAA